MSVYLKIPGSTSNLGPGFDSIGLAINRYLFVYAQEANKWDIQFEDDFSPLPKIKDNLIYQAALNASHIGNKELPPLKIRMRNEIPLARGLGSSAAAIVAGIELADTLLKLQLSMDEKAHIASKMEGHPDNVTASLYGGLTISSHIENTTETLACPAPEIDLIAMIPNEELKTKIARSVLPQQLPFKQAVIGSSVANVLVAAILQNKWELAGKMMEKDVYHQPYRANLIPDLPKVMAFGHSLGVLGTILSGAGPTIICFVPKNKGKAFAQLLSEAFPNYQYEILTPEANGVVYLDYYSPII